jgi:hypothetical protein
MSNPRITVTFTEPQMDFLKRKSERLGITVSELVRRIVDQHRLDF